MRRLAVVNAAVSITALVSSALLLPRVSQAANPAATSALGQVRYIYRGLGIQPPHQGVHSGKKSDPLFDQYGLQTQQNQKASIGFHDGTVLHLNQETNAVITAHLTHVNRGEVAEYLAPGTDHKVQTAAAVASAIGTTYDVRTNGTTTVFVVLHGALEVQNSSGSVVVKSGHQTSVVPNKPPNPPTPADTKAAFAWTEGIPTPDLGEDVALDANGGQVLAFSSQREGGGDQGHATHIDDGLLTQGWESATGKTTNQSVTVGFQGGNFFRVSDIIIDPAATYGDPASEDLKDFEIRVSLTGTTDADFTTVFRASCVQKDALQHFTLPVPVRAKYVQLVALNNFGSSNRVAVAEWEVVATASLFAQPHGVAVDGKGFLYVADTNSNRIDKVSPRGKIVAHWGKKGSGPGQFLAPEGIALDGDGNIYVVDTFNGRVEKLSPTGRFLEKFGSPGVGNGQFQFPRGIAVDGLGNIYVSDLGGDFTNGLRFFARIQKFSAKGKFITAYDAIGSPGDSGAPGGLAFDSHGNLIVANSGDNDILTISPTGQVIRTYGIKGTGAGQFDTPDDVAIDGKGNIYVADSGNFRIQRIDPAGKATVWGSFGYGRGQFALPSGIAADKQGNVYVADTNNSRLQKLSGATGKVEAVWGKLAIIPTILGKPAGIAVDPQGNVWVTDMDNDRLQERSSSGRLEAIVGYHGAVANEKGTLGLEQFYDPHGIAIDQNGEIYVADTNNSRIQELAPKGPIGVIGGPNSPAPKQFYAPWGVAVDRQGNIYVADTYVNQLYKLSPDGKVIWKYSAQGLGPGQLDFPVGIAVDSKGNVYVSNFGSPTINTFDGRIIKFSPDGKPLDTWGAADPLGQNRFLGPVGLTVDSQDNIYVADSGHNAVDKLTSDGKVLAVFPIPGPNANPFGVAVDTHGNIYVADNLNQRIVKLAPTGEVLGVWS